MRGRTQQMLQRVACAVGLVWLGVAWIGCDLTDAVQACSKQEQCPPDQTCDVELGACVRPPPDGGSPDGGNP